MKWAGYTLINILLTFACLFLATTRSFDHLGDFKNLMPDGTPTSTCPETLSNLQGRNTNGDLYPPHQPCVACSRMPMFLLVLLTARSLCMSSNIYDGHGDHHTNYHLLEPSGNILSEKNNSLPPFHFSLLHLLGNTHGVHRSLKNVKTRHSDIEEAFRYLVKELDTYASPVSVHHFQTSSAQELTLPRPLDSKGELKKESGGEFQTRLHLLKYRQPQVQKRIWNRLSIQTRYAPLGTKLVPIRKPSNSGATLLRYGRSWALH